MQYHRQTRSDPDALMSASDLRIRLRFFHFFKEDARHLFTPAARGRRVHNTPASEHCWMDSVLKMTSAPYALTTRQLFGCTPCPLDCAPFRWQRLHLEAVEGILTEQH